MSATAHLIHCLVRFNYLFCSFVQAAKYSICNGYIRYNLGDLLLEKRWREMRQVGVTIRFSAVIVLRKAQFEVYGSRPRLIEFVLLWTINDEEIFV